MRYKKLAAVILGGVCLVAIIYFVFGRTASGAVVIDEKVAYPVTYVIDGDTFKASVDGHVITVRVLGMNTPETVDPRKPVECYGPEASAEAKTLLDGRSVRLVANPNRERMDKYGRYLLYVYRDDGMFYNEYMIQQGYAREYTVGTAYSMQSEFRKAEAAAKAAGRGLWGKCDITNH